MTRCQSIGVKQKKWPYHTAGIPITAFRPVERRNVDLSTVNKPVLKQFEPRLAKNISTHVRNHDPGNGPQDYGVPSHKVEEPNGPCKDLPWTNYPTTNERTQDLPSTNIEPLGVSNQPRSCPCRIYGTYTRHKSGEVIGSRKRVRGYIRADSRKRKGKRREKGCGSIVPMVDQM